MGDIETRTAELNRPVGGYWMGTDEGEVHCWYDRPFVVRGKQPIPDQEFCGELCPGATMDVTITAFAKLESAKDWLKMNADLYMQGDGGILALWVENWNMPPGEVLVDLLNS